MQFAYIECHQQMPNIYSCDSFVVVLLQLTILFCSIRTYISMKTFGFYIQIKIKDFQQTN
ncbi:hypothetical protein pb186bvf_006499 [Paramecium bursaria]